jgi:hypothetical protein
MAPRYAPIWLEARIADDYEWAPLPAYRRYTPLKQPRVLVVYRHHDGNVLYVVFVIVAAYPIVYRSSCIRYVIDQRYEAKEYRKQYNVYAHEHLIRLSYLETLNL